MEDSTDILGISGEGGFETPKPPSVRHWLVHLPSFESGTPIEARSVTVCVERDAVTYTEWGQMCLCDTILES